MQMLERKKEKKTPDGLNVKMCARKRLCTCGGGGDTVYCPLHVGLILSVAHE